MEGWKGRREELGWNDRDPSCSSCIVPHYQVLFLSLTTSLQGNILNEYKHRILMVRDPFINNISSSLVRKCVEEGTSVKYVVPDAVLGYIKQHNLYRF